MCIRVDIVKTFFVGVTNVTVKNVSTRYGEDNTRGMMTSNGETEDYEMAEVASHSDSILGGFFNLLKSQWLRYPINSQEVAGSQPHDAHGP